jgi:hypothetical protein
MCLLFALPCLALGSRRWGILCSGRWDGRKLWVPVDADVLMLELWIWMLGIGDWRLENPG